MDRDAAAAAAPAMVLISCNVVDWVIDAGDLLLTLYDAFGNFFL